MDRAAAAGVTTLAVTDHDTTAAVDEVRSLARGRGIEAAPGIEITAVEEGRDLHVLGYFFDPAHDGLQSFLAEQRRIRRSRLDAMIECLTALGMPIEADSLLDAGEDGFASGRAVGRPLIARAMVRLGYVASTDEAFDRWIGHGQPAYVPRLGASPEQVIGVIHAAGGLASLAHPTHGRLAPRIRALAAAGLDAIEVYHPDHDAAAVAGFAALARELGLCVTGGSDFHGDPSHGLSPGAVTLPQDEFDRFKSTWQHARR